MPWWAALLAITEPFDLCLRQIDPADERPDAGTARLRTFAAPGKPGHDDGIKPPGGDTPLPSPYTDLGVVILLAIWGGFDGSYALWTPSGPRTCPMGGRPISTQLPSCTTTGGVHPRGKNVPDGLIAMGRKAHSEDGRGDEIPMSPHSSTIM
jgi:hypothetical protein